MLGRIPPTDWHHVLVISPRSQALTSEVSQWLWDRGITHEAWELGEGVHGLYDLAREEVWEGLRARIYLDEFSGVIAELPSETFNSENRGTSGKDLYGKTHGSRVDRSDDIRLGTLRALRAVIAVRVAEEMSVPWMLVGPAPMLGGGPVAWSLSEVSSFLARSNSRVE
jgi:hypothetical protein